MFNSENTAVVVFVFCCYMWVKRITDWLTELLEASAYWCSRGDSVGHEWLQLRQRGRACGWCAVTHIVQQSGGVEALCFSRDVHSLCDCKAASNIFLLYFIWLACCAWKIPGSDVKECIIHTYTLASLQIIPFDWRKNRSYFITCVQVCMPGFWADSLSNIVLPIATHKEIHLSESTGFTD